MYSYPGNKISVAQVPIPFSIFQSLQLIIQLLSVIPARLLRFREHSFELLQQRNLDFVFVITRLALPLPFV